MKLYLSTLVLMAGALAGPVPASGQTTAAPTLTLEGARTALAGAMAEARAKAAPGGVIAVVDAGGHLIALERIDGTFAAGANISIGKARTAVLFKRPTLVFEDIIRNGRTSMVALDDFTPLQGGIPIVIDGQVVGGIGVSGAASAQQDEELALAGARALDPAARMTAAADVLYFRASEVATSFRSGAVLLDGQGRNYMVHTSRRDAPGQAEVHTEDTDIIYMLKGRVTFVTGGEILDGRSTAADEIRGSSIQGGDSRRLVPGDIIVVPRGTPHWFKEVAGPVEYYTIKVRNAAGPSLMTGGAQ